MYGFCRFGSRAASRIRLYLNGAQAFGYVRSFAGVFLLTWRIFRLVAYHGKYEDGKCGTPIRNTRIFAKLSRITRICVSKIPLNIFASRELTGFLADMLRRRILSYGNIVA